MTKEKLDLENALQAKIDYMELCHSQLQMGFPNTCSVPEKFRKDVQQELILQTQQLIKEKVKCLRAEFKALK